MSLNTLKTRIDYMGGNNLGRIKQQKLRSFRAALKNDYNSRTVMTPLGEIYQALINDDNTKPDYDKRFISIDYQAQLQPGDVVECVDHNTHWMIYLQDLVEIAYFKSEIVRCRYQIEINDEEYWIYFQGPVETALRWNLQKDINWNDLNFSGTIYIQKTDETKEYFNRFTKLKIDGHTWQVKVVDTLTVPGIIELEVEEYFDSLTDDLIEVKKVDNEFKIFGLTEVMRGDIVGYRIDDSVFNTDDEWSIIGDDAIIKELRSDGQICVVSIIDDTSETFTIKFGELTLPVIIAKSQEMIIGDNKVYPYSNHKYTAKNTSGVYTLSNNKATILSQKDGVCNIEITTSKKGSFDLIYTINDEIVYTLPITILSL